MNKVKKNFIYLSMYKILEMLLPMITSPLLSRRLGAEALGTYSYTYSIVSIFAVIAQLGVYNYGMREIAKVRNDSNKLNKTYSSIFLVHIITGIIVAFIYFSYVLLFSKSSDFIFFLIQGGVLLSVILDNAFVFVGLENIKAISIRDAIAKFLTFALVVLLIKKPSDLVLYFIVMIGGVLSCRLISLLYARKMVKFVKVNLADCKIHIKPMIILMIPILASTIYQSMDKIMIETWHGKEYVGYYECASKALIPRNIITVLGTVLCPSIANMFAQKKDKEATNKIEYSLTISLIMSYAFTFGIWAIAKEFAPWFWGENFSICSNMLIGLAISIPFWCIGEVIRNQYLLPIGKDKQYMISFVVGVLVNALFNLILIPKYYAIGAIIATIIAEVTMSGIQMIMVKGKLNYWKSIISSIPYLIISAIMLVCVRVVAKLIELSLFWSLIIELFSGIILFMLLVLIFEKITNKKIILSFISNKTRKE